MQTEREQERAAIVAFLRRAACNAIAGDARPAFVVKTTAKTHAVLAFALAKLADHVERGDHLTPSSEGEG